MTGGKHQQALRVACSPHRQWISPAEENIMQFNTTSLNLKHGRWSYIKTKRCIVLIIIGLNDDAIPPSLLCLEYHCVNDGLWWISLCHTMIDMAIKAERRWDPHPKEPQQLVSARSEGAGVMTLFQHIILFLISNHCGQWHLFYVSFCSSLPLPSGLGMRINKIIKTNVRVAGRVTTHTWLSCCSEHNYTVSLIGGDRQNSRGS